MITIPQRYRQTDGWTDNLPWQYRAPLGFVHYWWARTRGAQLSAGYTVNTHKMVARYAPHILISAAPHTTAAMHQQFIARTDGPDTRTASQIDSTQLKAGK